MDPQESLKQLYKQYVGSEPTEIKLIDKAGSNRRYYRLSGDKSVVGVIGESREENEAFIYIANPLQGARAVGSHRLWCERRPHGLHPGRFGRQARQYPVEQNSPQQHHPCLHPRGERTPAPHHA